MKVQKLHYIPAKYPTIGEIIDFFMKNLEIEFINDADRKRYQRFIKEENITIDEYNELLEYCIDNILDEIVNNKEQNKQKVRVRAFFENYKREVQKEECYHTSQKYLNRYLLQKFFLPFSIHFSVWIQRLLQLKKEQRSILGMYFQFVQQRNQLNRNAFREFIFKELDNLTHQEKSDKTLIQDIENWLTGSIYPNNNHIKILAQFFSNTLCMNKVETEQNLMIGRIINNLDSNVIEEIFSTNSEINLPSLIPHNIVEKMLELYNMTCIDREKTELPNDSFFIKLIRN